MPFQISMIGLTPALALQLQKRPTNCAGKAWSRPWQIGTDFKVAREGFELKPVGADIPTYFMPICRENQPLGCPMGVFFWAPFVLPEKSAEIEKTAEFSGFFVSGVHPFPSVDLGFQGT